MTQRATPVGRMEPVRGQISEAWTGKKIADIEAEHQEWADGQPTVQRCASCPAFRFEGSAADGRAAFQAHLLAVHPDRVKAKRRKRGMPGDARMTEPLFDLTPEPKPLTDRQQWIYGLIVAAGSDGLTADELGALMHGRKHDSGERCAFCGQDGARALRERAIAERVVKRGGSGWVARETPARVEPSAQVRDLPGSSFEDIFNGSEAA